MFKITGNVDLKKAEEYGYILPRGKMNNSEKLEIINKELTKLYNKLEEGNYTTKATLNIINSIKELELLKVALEGKNA